MGLRTDVDALLSFRQSLGVLVKEHDESCVCSTCLDSIKSQLSTFKQEACACRKLQSYVLEFLDSEDRMLRLLGLWMLAEYGQDDFVKDALVRRVNTEMDLTVLCEIYRLLVASFPAEAAKLETSDNIVVRFFVKDFNNFQKGNS